MTPPDVRGAAPADHRNRPQDTETATAKYASGDHDRTAGTDGSAALAALVGYVIHGRDRTPLDRLCWAAREGRSSVEDGADLVTVAAALTTAAEAAGLPRRVAEGVLRRTLRGGRAAG